MGTLTSFKRDIADKKIIALEMTERFGHSGMDIPQRLRGTRQIIRATSYGILIRNKDGKESRLEIKGKLASYDGEQLIVYDPAYRELSDREKNMLDEINRLQDKGEKLEAIKAVQDNDMEYMIGTKFVKGKRYDWATGKVIDRHIKGEPVLKYRCIRTEVKKQEPCLG